MNENDFIAPDDCSPLIRVSLPRGNAIEIRLRAKIRKTEMAAIRKLFDLALEAVVEDDPAPSPEVFP